jgi:hypothetical protein
MELMKKWLNLLLLVFFAGNLDAQILTTDTLNNGNVFLQKDGRIDVLGQKLGEYNTSLAKNIRSGKGYRLMLLSTNDRNLALQTRSKLLQMFPEHKVYMMYQNPFIKLKMGNFTDIAEAEKLKKLLLSQKIVTGNIYILPETVEVKPEIVENTN